MRGDVCRHLPCDGRERVIGACKRSERC
ncbi:hypothetical protein DXC81_02070 [Collinsella tanakaei]|uniref:Beta-defensin-like domain-containing protein n=1 Tax=Collinsella tanakaei TaxID=626935 RepID=A0A3E4QWM5_9ACTN|nr:hypothetical protein DXC81_02070 [Collinsella tanakaei]